ncbi:MAG: hypothetical protein CM1200mP27_11930 [Chloroflexota bacterium]|nr:MAG: hypothetical protein CM1200mP27_11930 [Chloroflexota bacterium]
MNGITLRDAQNLFVLAGQMEVSVKDGTTRVFNPGDVLLAEDMTGQGHLNRFGRRSYTSVSMGIPDLSRAWDIG